MIKIENRRGIMNKIKKVNLNSIINIDSGVPREYYYYYTLKYILFSMYVFIALKLSFFIYV